MTRTVQTQVLINARALIAEPAHWTRATLARTADDRRVGWDDPSASKWCALGAIYRAGHDLLGDVDEATRIGKEVAQSICPPGSSLLREDLATVNDRRGHAAVLGVFDKALEAA
jgi:hypothetical protein